MKKMRNIALKLHCFQDFSLFFSGQVHPLLSMLHHAPSHSESILVASLRLLWVKSFFFNDSINIKWHSGYLLSTVSLFLST